MANLFTEQSTALGYPVIQTNSKGQQTVLKPTGNVSGIPIIQTTGSNVTTLKPTENLTGYPVYSTGSNVFSNLANTAQLQKFGGMNVLQSSGNITGWPTLWQQFAPGGDLTNEFVIPGYTPAGSIAYDENGFPMFNTDTPPSVPSISSPKPAISPPAPSVGTPTALPSQDYAKQAKQASTQRRLAYRTFIGETLA